MDRASTGTQLDYMVTALEMSQQTCTILNCNFLYLCFDAILGTFSRISVVLEEIYPKKTCKI